MSPVEDRVRANGVGAPRARQARSTATRIALVDAAARRFAETGYEGTSVREVLVEARLTKGALYFHFTDKQALADAVVDEMIRSWRQVFAEIKDRGLDSLSALVAETTVVGDRLLHDPVARGGTRLLNDPMVPTAQAQAHYDLVERSVLCHLEAAASEGSLRPTVAIARLARTVVTLVAGHNLIAERTGRLDTLPARITSMWDAILPIIATDAWLGEHRTS